MIKWTFLLLCMVLLGSCRKDLSKPPNDDDKLKAFVSVLLDTLERHAVHRQSIDWHSFRQQVQMAVDKEDGYSLKISAALHRALDLLADDHTTFRYATGSEIYGVTNLSCSDSAATVIPFDTATIGYVKLHGIKSISGAPVDNYINDVQEQIQRADKPGLKGWIVDLRGDFGGNFFPMFRGLAPILGPDTLVYWLHSDGQISYTANEPYYLSQVNQLFRPNPKVAVLIDKSVASSGEATTLSFRNRPNTRMFGTNTCGISTERIAYTIKDVGVLNLAAGIMADRTKRGDGKSIAPDEWESSPAAAMQKAIQWLEQ